MNIHFKTHRVHDGFDACAAEIFEEHRQHIFRRTDRMFAVLMVVQWIAGTIAALMLSPRTWAGASSSVHPHVWLAFIFGGVLASLPVYLAWRLPGKVLTRHTIAVTQLLFSALLIHISGGRIETHFHVFGSLAFLAFYRDWTVLVPATLLVAVDHFVRGVFWPASVFGSANASSWLWVEHAAWVLFEDIFLVLSCRDGVREMRATAERTAELERINADVRQRTEELEQAYRTKDSMIETALDAVVGMDFEGRIIGWNSQAERTFGWTAAEVLGRPLADVIITPEKRHLHQQGLERLAETGESSMLNQRFEVEVLHRDGHRFPAELAIAMIQTPESTTFCGFIRDITERRQAGQALQRAKEAAEAANQAKSRFLAHMSHEIRTPLNGILGFSELLLTNPDIDEAERIDYLQTVTDSGQHLLGLMNDVLDLSKIESGQMDVERIECAPHDIIAEVISVLRVRARMKDITLEYRWAGDVPERVVTDPARLRQLLMNLVGNAIKFTEVGGVRVVARVVNRHGQSRLAIDVVDTGIGIAAENLERVFAPFAQADESITRRFGGTGLGLAICREIVSLLGGELTVQSELGVGSTFAVTIDPGDLSGVPTYEAPHAADLLPRRKVKSYDQQKPLPACSVLLVEDGETNRKLIGLLLRRAGATVTTAENGREGVELALHQPFDVVLMDMQMPVMDGYSAASELRSLGYDRPIIALTAHAMKGDEERCRAAGCSGYLTKPIDGDRLLAAISEALTDGAGSGAAPVAAESKNASSSESSPLVSSLPADDVDFRELVSEFVTRLGEWISEMQTAFEQNDLAELGRLAHCLKGSGGTAGFDAFTKPAGALERAAKGSDADQCRRLIGSIRALADRIEAPELVT